jgi:hypothetical protein
METNEIASIETVTSPALATLAKANPTRAELVDVIIDEIDVKLRVAGDAISARLRELEKIEFTIDDCINSLARVKFQVCFYSGRMGISDKDRSVVPEDAKAYAVFQEAQELHAQLSVIRQRRNLVDQPRKIKAYITKRLLEQSKDGCTLLEALKHIAETFTASSVIE